MNTRTLATRLRIVAAYCYGFSAVLLAVGLGLGLGWLITR